MVLSAEDEPFLAAVTTQNAFLRSGPSDDYYATNGVAVGQELEVYYVIDDQWCAVRPPTNCFTWVDARNVRLEKNQVGVVLINGVSARVGSELNNSCGAVQVVLDRGEKVFVFERVETPNDIDTPVWYKIAPPAGEFRFIRMNELNFGDVPKVSDSLREPVTEQPRVLHQQSPILLVSGEMPQQPSSRPGSSQVSSVVIPPGSLPIPGTTRNSGHVVQNQAFRVAANTRPSDNSAITQHTQTNTAGNPGIDSNDFREIVGQLKLDLADALMEQETANETMQSLAHQARMLHHSAANPNDRAEVYQLIAGIERATRVRQHEAKQNRSGDTASQANSQYDERYDRRVVHLPDVQDTAEPEAFPPAPPLQLSPQPSHTSNTGAMSAGTSQRLALPRLDRTGMSTFNPPEINTTPEPNLAAPIERYSAQESFFDRSGRHVAAQNNTGQYRTGQYGAEQYVDPSSGHYSGQQDFEIYLVNGRYVDASGQVLDGQTLSAILHGADVVLMYDPQTGGYRQMSQHQLRNGQYPGIGRQQSAVQKSWLQRFISGELFQSDTSQGQQHEYPQHNHVPTGSGFAPHTYQSAFGNQSAYGDNGYAPMQQPLQQPSNRGLFATSQPSLIPQQQNRNNNAMPGMYPGMYPNNAPRGWQGPMGDGMPSGGMIPQEITLPDGVQVPGEMVIYDESQGINLLGNAQNALQQDQLTLLLQQMATPATTDNRPAILPQAAYGTQHANLPLTEAESNMRTIQLRSAHQDATPNRNAGHQVTGQLENGVGRVSREAFDAIGKLGRVRNASDDMPQFALVDPGGKTVCLVTPTPGVELGIYINQTVGITGIRGNYVHEGETFRHVSAKAVYPFVGNRE